MLAWVAVLLLAALLRLVPGTLWRAASTDAGYHLLLRRELLRNRMRMPDRVAALALDERQSYPWLFHALMALVPERVLLRVPALASAVLDSLHTALVGVAATLIAGRTGVPVPAEYVGLVAALLVATAPALLAVGIGPRAYDITPRAFGELLFTAALLAAGWYVADGAVAGLALAATAGALIALSSKFGMQALVFCLPVLAIGSGWRGLLVLAVVPLGAVGVALLLSAGRYRHVAWAQLVHLAFYRRRLQFDHPSLVIRNRWRDMIRPFGSWLSSGLRDFGALRRALQSAEQNTWVLLVTRNVLWLAIAAACLAGLAPEWNESVWRLWLLLWLVAPLPAFVLTSLRTWRFLGEAERYLEYAIAPAAMLAAAAFWSAPENVRPLLITGYAILNLPVLVYAWARRRHESLRVKPGDLEEVIARLAGLPAGSMVLPVPMTLAFSLAYRLELRFLFTIDPIVWARDYDLLFARYPWPATALEEWRRERGADYVVMDARALHLDSAPRYDLGGLRCEFANPGFAVYSFPRPASR